MILALSYVPVSDVNFEIKKLDFIFQIIKTIHGFKIFEMISRIYIVMNIIAIIQTREFYFNLFLVYIIEY